MIWASVGPIEGPKLIVIILICDWKGKRTNYQLEKENTKTPFRQEQSSIAQGDADIAGAKVDRGQRRRKTVPHQSSTPQKVSTVGYDQRMQSLIWSEY